MADVQSGWSLGIISAFAGSAITLSVTIAAGFFLEDYKRHRDMQTTAMAFLGEIKTLVVLAERLNLAGQAKAIADSLRGQDALPEGYGTGRTYTVPNPVFEKAADKIGLLPGELPMDVSEFYNYIMGLRMAYFDALAASPMSVAARVRALDFVSVNYVDLLVLGTNKVIPALERVVQNEWRLLRAVRHRWTGVKKSAGGLKTWRPNQNR